MSMEEFAAHVRTLIDFMDKLAPIESTEPGEEEVTADADGEEEAKDGENPFEKEGEEKAKDADGEEEEAKDADEEEKKEAGMDAAMVRKMIADSHKEIARGMSGKNKLAESLSALIGSFDHSEMLTKSDVAKYAAPKLGLKPVKGQELSAVEGFLAAKPNTRTFSVVTQDGKKATAKVSKIQQFING